jgi:hypothetical protein
MQEGSFIALPPRQPFELSLRLHDVPNLLFSLVWRKPIWRRVVIRYGILDGS